MFIRYLCQYFTETQAIFVHRNGAELSLNGRTVKKKKKKKKKMLHLCLCDDTNF